MSNKLFFFSIILVLSSCIKRIDGPIDIELSTYTRHEINLNYALNPSSNLVEYIDKVYYNLADSSIVKSVSSNEWSIAFSSDPNSDRKIIMNYALGKSCNGFTRRDTNWMSPVTENDYGTNTLKYANHFDTFADLITTQGINNHYVYYLNYSIYDRYYKFQVLNYSSSSMTIRYAYIDGTNEKTITVPIGTNTNFTYFSFKSNAPKDLEPADKNSWDLEFTRYTTLVTEFNSTQMYTVTGVINNPSRNIVVAQLDDIKIEDINPALLQSLSYSSYLGKIGYSWKKFSGASQDGFYTIPTRSYVIQGSGKYYAFQFVEYSKLVSGSLVKGYPSFLQRNF
jgi:hypothetical protein